METQEKIEELEKAIGYITEAENLLIMIGMGETQLALADITNREIMPQFKFLCEQWAAELKGKKGAYNG